VIGHFRSGAGTCFGRTQIGLVPASGSSFARIVPGVVETGVHHHAALFLLACRTTGAVGGAELVKPGRAHADHR
jgi:hypothetical protein